MSSVLTEERAHADAQAQRKNILFVDDDPAVLGGLRDALRRQRRRWNLKFVGSAAEALAELERASYDVVVSDMRMPQVDGTALLTQVQARHPGAARIVLSGHADPVAIVKSLPVAHQFLSKPCEPGALELVLERTCALSALLQNEAIRKVVGGLEKLPSLPRAYLQLTQAMARPDVKIADIVAIVERDPAMSVKILQVVNSAYFGLPRRMTGIGQAVTYLGLDLLKSLALSSHVFGSLSAEAMRGHGLHDFERASLSCARLTRRFVAAAGRGDDGFTAGLVHDIGRIVLAVCLDERHRQIVAQSQASGMPIHYAEQAALGVTHAGVGAYLLGIWGLPLAVVEAVACHHQPSRIPHHDTELAAAVHVADALVQERLGGGPAGQWLDPVFIHDAGFAAKLKQWRAAAEEEFAGSGDSDE